MTSRCGSSLMRLVEVEDKLKGKYEDMTSRWLSRTHLVYLDLEHKLLDDVNFIAEKVADK